MVVAQLVERSIPTPEIRGSNTVIGKFYMCFMSTVLKRRKYIKEAVNRPFIKRNRKKVKYGCCDVRWILSKLP